MRVLLHTIYLRISHSQFAISDRPCVIVKTVVYWCHAFVAARPWAHDTGLCHGWLFRYFLLLQLHPFVDRYIDPFNFSQVEWAIIDSCERVEQLIRRTSVCRPSIAYARQRNFVDAR